jgi:hypothetical protein
VINNSFVIYDLNIDGGIDARGNIQNLYDAEAVSNAVKTWLLSMKGDYVGFPQKGGPLIDFIEKPMSEIVRIQITQSVTSGLANEFPELEILYYDIKANLEKKYWEIIVSGYTKKEKIGFYTNEKIKVRA